MRDLEVAINQLQKDLGRSQKNLSRSRNRERLGLSHESHVAYDNGVVDGLTSTLALMTTIAKERNIPTIVCLCGSTRFIDAYIECNRSETLAGRIVLSVGLFGHAEGLDMQGPVKALVDELHKRKIDLADEILVINVGGYVGESTKSEIEYAKQLGKKIRWLEPVSD